MLLLPLLLLLRAALDPPVQCNTRCCARGHPAPIPPSHFCQWQMANGNCCPAVLLPEGGTAAVVRVRGAAAVGLTQSRLLCRYAELRNAVMRLCMCLVVQTG